QFTGIVHAAVAGRVDLDHVDGARAVRGKLLTRIALAARSRGRSFHAVQRPGQNARAGRLPAAAWPAEQVRMVDAPRGKGVLQRPGDAILADPLGERRGWVLAVQRQTASHATTVEHASDEAPPVRRAGRTGARRRLKRVNRAPRAPARAYLSLLPSGP